MAPHLEVAAFDIAGQSHHVRDHRAWAVRAPCAGDRDLLVDPLQRLPVNPGGEVGEEKGDRIARSGAVEELQERVVAATHQWLFGTVRPRSSWRGTSEVLAGGGVRTGSPQLTPTGDAGPGSG